MSVSISSYRPRLCRREQPNHQWTDSTPQAVHQRGRVPLFRAFLRTAQATALVAATWLYRWQYGGLRAPEGAGFAGGRVRTTFGGRTYGPPNATGLSQICRICRKSTQHGQKSSGTVMK